MSNLKREEARARASLVLESTEAHKIHYALRFGFKISNNEAKYKALITRLRLAKELKVEAIDIYNESQLVVY